MPNLNEDSVVQLDFIIYSGRANAVKLQLTDDGAAINHLSLTRVAVYVGSTLFDSNTTPALFDLTNADHIVLKLAAASPVLAVGKYSCKLVIYDVSEYALGYVWPEVFVLNVLAEPS
jgi:hypothetical protein